MKWGTKFPDFFIIFKQVNALAKKSKTAGKGLFEFGITEPLLKPVKRTVVKPRPGPKETTVENPNAIVRADSRGSDLMEATGFISKTRDPFAGITPEINDGCLLYKCRSCGMLFTNVVRINPDPAQRWAYMQTYCPGCKSTEVHKTWRK